MPVGENKVASMVKEVAQLCDFKDFEKYAAHDCWHQLGTLLYSNPAVPEKIAMAQMRHTSTATKATYTHMNTMIDTNLQATIHQGLHGGATALIPAPSPVAPIKKSELEESKPAATFQSSIGTAVVVPAAAKKPQGQPPVAQPLVENKKREKTESPPASSGMKRNAVSEKEHSYLQRKYKKLKKSNTNNLEEARKERAEMSSTAIELKKKYEDENNEIKQELQRTKEHQRILKDENKELKQELQRTKEELNRRESEQRMFQYIQQQQQQQQPRAPICAIM